MVNLYHTACELLKELISTPSFSKEEHVSASIIAGFFERHKVAYERHANNIYALNKYYDINKPTILLNSHHDTVLPNKGYTLDPFAPVEKEDKLFGLGSNDAGASLVSLIAVFLHYYDSDDLKYNLVIAASAEEEISGVNGIELILPSLGNIEFGIVGEPTSMLMAVAERGLLVIDCIAEGRAGHAARNEGDNAFYRAVDDVNWIRNHRFSKVSELLGECRLTVTVIDTPNRQHNVVPAECRFVIDARINELYTFDEVLGILTANLKSKFKPRSTRLKSTSISLDHPLVKAGVEMGISYYGSPTTSDKALLPFPTLKIGPGDSARSHTADEFIFLSEIKNGIDSYIKLLEKIL